MITVLLLLYHTYCVVVTISHILCCYYITHTVLIGDRSVRPESSQEPPGSLVQEPRLLRREPVCGGV